MTDFSTAVFDMVQVLLDNPFIRLMLFLPLLLFPFRLLWELVFDGRPVSLPIGELFGFLGKWIKNAFITLSIKILGFETVYKLGWARPGIDFFDCGQDCAACPKFAECNDPLRCSAPDEEVSGDD